MQPVDDRIPNLIYPGGSNSWTLLVLGERGRRRRHELRKAKNKSLYDTVFGLTLVIVPSSTHPKVQIQFRLLALAQYQRSYLG